MTTQTRTQNLHLWLSLGEYMSYKFTESIKTPSSYQNFADFLNFHINLYSHNILISEFSPSHTDLASQDKLSTKCKLFINKKDYTNDIAIKILDPLNFSHLEPFADLNSLQNNIETIQSKLNKVLKFYLGDLKNYDRIIMYFLLGIAEAISSLGETPIAAAILNRQKELCQISFNQREINQDPLGHAEFKSIEKFCKDNNSWRLDKQTLYVTLEPCLMCCGIIRQTRLGELVYACKDPKQGCVISKAELLDLDLSTMKCQHRIIDEDISILASEQLKNFFKKIRQRNKNIGSKSLRKKLISENKKELI